MNPAAPAHLREAGLRGAQTRKRRATLKHRLYTGDTDITAILMHPPPETLRMEIGALMRAAPGLGPTTVTRALSLCQIRETRTLDELTTKQRACVILFLRRNHPRLFGGMG